MSLKKEEEHKTQLQELKTTLLESHQNEIQVLKNNHKAEILNKLNEIQVLKNNHKTEILNKLKNIKTQSELMGVKASSNYSGSSPYVETLKSRDLNTAILTSSSSNEWIEVEFEEPILLNIIEIGGCTIQGWNNSSGYGAGGQLKVSVDQLNWEQVATIPSGFGNQIVECKLKPCIAKFLRFEHSGWLAIGYVGVKI